MTAIIESALEQSRSEILETELKAELGLLKSELSARIKSAASPAAAIATGIVAWLLSIAITFLVAVAGLPHWLAALSEKLNQ